MASVERITHVRGSRHGLTTLEQSFRFSGEGAHAAAFADVLLTAPLTGSNSVFGERPGDETSHLDTIRALRGVSPAPGFRFDVELVQSGRAHAGHEPRDAKHRGDRPRTAREGESRSERVSTEGVGS